MTESAVQVDAIEELDAWLQSTILAEDRRKPAGRKGCKEGSSHRRSSSLDEVSTVDLLCECFGPNMLNPSHIDDDDYADVSDLAIVSEHSLRGSEYPPRVDRLKSLTSVMNRAPHGVTRDHPYIGIAPVIITPVNSKDVISSRPAPLTAAKLPFVTHGGNGLPSDTATPSLPCRMNLPSRTVGSGHLKRRPKKYLRKKSKTNMMTILSFLNAMEESQKTQVSIGKSKASCSREKLLRMMNGTF